MHSPRDSQQSGFGAIQETQPLHGNHRVLVEHHCNVYRLRQKLSRIGSLEDSLGYI